MTPEEAAKAIERKAQAIRSELAWAQRKNAFALLQVARQYSEGPYSLAELRRMGHPYATRHPAAPLDPAIINRQTGRFAASWRLEEVTAGDGSMLRLTNDAPYAGFLKTGTRFMIARPIEEKIAVETEPLITRNIEIALERALGRN